MTKSRELRGRLDSSSQRDLYEKNWHSNIFTPALHSIKTRVSMQSPSSGTRAIGLLFIPCFKIMNVYRNYFLLVRLALALHQDQSEHALSSAWYTSYRTGTRAIYRTSIHPMFKLLLIMELLPIMCVYIERLFYWHALQRDNNVIRYIMCKKSNLISVLQEWISSVCAACLSVWFFFLPSSVWKIQCLSGDPISAEHHVSLSTL